MSAGGGGEAGGTVAVPVEVGWPYMMDLSSIQHNAGMGGASRVSTVQCGGYGSGGWGRGVRLRDS